MNKPLKKDKAELSSQQNAEVDNFTSDLIKDLNREHGQKIAFNLSTDDAPTVIKRWISTGSRLLDYMIANRRNGGLPEGRIIEIYGSPSTGKSHIALQICKSTQKLGGIVVYIDTENATSLEKLHQMGIDVSKRFVFIETSCTEEVFSVIENTILKAKVINKDLPITIVWDSVAATSPKQELLNGYDKDTIGLQARVISKAMRKITGLIGSTNTTLICLNQTRTKVGVMFGDPTTTPGGMAIPFHASVRLALTGGSKIMSKDGETALGINVIARTAKNKVAMPFRKSEFEIHFGKGIVEHEQIFDIMRDKGAQIVDGKKILIDGKGAWKQMKVNDEKTGEVLYEKSFYKNEFDKLFLDKEAGPYLEAAFEKIMVKDASNMLSDLDEKDEKEKDE